MPGASAFGRSRAAPPIRAPVRTRLDIDYQPALEFAHHDHLRKRVPHREESDVSARRAESPVGAQHDRLRKAVPGHLMNGDTDHLVHNASGLQMYAERPESPVGARRGRLRRSAPSLELPPRYYSDVTDPSSPKGMYSGISERPTRHSERSRGAGVARPGTGDRAGWDDADNYRYDGEETKNRGRRMYATGGGDKLKPEDHMAAVMQTQEPDPTGNSRSVSQPPGRSEGSGQGVQQSSEADRDPGQLRQDRAAHMSGHNTMRMQEPLRASISVLDSHHAEQPADGDEGAARDVVVGQRVLGQLVARKNKLRNALPLLDSSCTGRMSFQDFSEGLKSAGVILGEADRRSVWSDAGGSMVPRDGGRKGERVPAGEVDIATFMSRLEHSTDSEDWGIKKMRAAGYSQHMQSSLTKGLLVRDDVEQFDPTGGGMHLRRGYAPAESSPPPHGAGASEAGVARPGAAAAAYPPRNASPMRWTKTEENYRDLIRQRKEALKQIFHAKSPDAEPGGSALSFQEFKGSIRSAGITLSDFDFETLWRRVDCLGRVKYEHVAKAFDLTDRRSVGEPGGSLALPHFREAGRDAAQGEPPLEREAAEFASSLSAERIARALVGGAPAPGHTSFSINHEGGKHHFTSPAQPRAKAGAQPRVWDVVKGTLARHPQHVPLDADVLHRALTAAGAVISKVDSRELWQRAQQQAAKKRVKAAADASPTIDDLHVVMQAAAQVQTPSKERALLSYGSRVGTATQPGPGGGGAGSSLEQQMQGGETREALDRLASGFLRNPHRLRQVFKKYDLDLQGSISREEFERGLSEQWTALRHDDVATLGRAVSDPHGVVEYESFCKLVAALPAGPGRAASPEQSHAEHRASSSATSYALQYASGSPRAGARRGAESPRGMSLAGTPGEQVGARSSSVQRERSTGSVRSRASGVAGLQGSVSSSLVGSGPADRSSWMHDKESRHRRILHSSSPAPSPSRGRSATPSAAPSGDAEPPAAGGAAASGATQRPPSPSASRAVQVGWGEAGKMPGGRDVAATKILHVASGPPLATAVHRHRSISVVVGS